MLANRCEAVDFVKVHIVVDLNGLLVDFDQIEGILLSFSGSAAARSGGATLDNDDPMRAVFARVEIQRISNVRAV